MGDYNDRKRPHEDSSDGYGDAKRYKSSEDRVRLICYLAAVESATSLPESNYAYFWLLCPLFDLLVDAITCVMLFCIYVGYINGSGMPCCAGIASLLSALLTQTSPLLFSSMSLLLTRILARMEAHMEVEVVPITDVEEDRHLRMGAQGTTPGIMDAMVEVTIDSATTCLHPDLFQWRQKLLSNRGVELVVSLRAI